LLDLIRRRVGRALDEFVGEVLATQPGERSNGAAPASASDTTKRCVGCGETLSVEQFHRDARSRDGRRSRCRSCVAASHVRRRGQQPGWQRRDTKALYSQGFLTSG
jgi:hypothetical protein